jgi:hypothetical protein
MTFHKIGEVVTATLPAIKMELKFNNESLTQLLRSNISCHMNKMLNQELIDTLTMQIVESIEFFVNKGD